MKATFRDWLRDRRKPRLIQRRVFFDRQPRGYPPCYTLEVTGGYGLFVQRGHPRAGTGFGNFRGPELVLYGAENLRKRGGMAWQYWKHHRRIACPYRLSEELNFGDGPIVVIDIEPTRLHDAWPDDVLAMGIGNEQICREYIHLSDRGGRHFDRAEKLRPEIMLAYERHWTDKIGSKRWKSNPFVWVLHALEGSLAIVQRGKSHKEPANA